jgi:hypothetical protein
MKWVFLACGIVLGALAGVSAMIFLQPQDQDQIIFAPKHFYNTEAAVIASGTLTGPDLAFPNNYYTIACYQDRKECVISNVEQVGHNQIGDLLAPLIFPVVKWSQGEVIAEDQAGLPSPVGCVKATITIDREQQSVLWCKSRSIKRNRGAKTQILRSTNGRSANPQVGNEFTNPQVGNEFLEASRLEMQ